MSILFPDSGELSVLGRRSALEAKDRIGYLPEERGVYRKMRVGAFLTYIGRLKGVTEPELPAADPRAASNASGLGGTERKRCEELSKGMLQKVQILAAIIHEPDLLILDEPFSGLDPVSTRLLRDLILEEHRRGATILFSTHVMPQAEEICQHVVMIHRGRKVLDEPMSGHQAPVRSARRSGSSRSTRPRICRALRRTRRGRARRRRPTAATTSCSSKAPIPRRRSADRDGVAAGADRTITARGSRMCSSASFPADGDGGPGEAAGRSRGGRNIGSRRYEEDRPTSPRASSWPPSARAASSSAC